jgi:hypothetical protein
VLLSHPHPTRSCPTLSTPGEVTLAENLIKERLVSDSNAELPVDCLLVGSWQPCPAIGELKTVIEAKNVLGFEAATTLDEMLDEVIAWIDEAVKNGTI